MASNRNFFCPCCKRYRREEITYKWRGIGEPRPCPTRGCEGALVLVDAPAKKKSKKRRQPKGH